jgi:hypothetical protein
MASHAKKSHFSLVMPGNPAITQRVMTRPQVEFCAKMLILAISGTFIWALYKLFLLMGIL